MKEEEQQDEGEAAHTRTCALSMAEQPGEEPNAYEGDDVLGL